MREGWAQILKLVVWVVGLLGVIVGVLYLFFIELVTVGHDGMAPTITSGDLVVVWRRTGAEMGDVVFCEHPEAGGQYVMGRVVAKRGMTIETARGGNVIISGTRIDHNYDGAVEFPSQPGETDTMRYGRIKMGATEHRFFERVGEEARIRRHEVERGVYLLGDNRTEWEHDSRAFGEVNPNQCLGTVFLRLVPSGRAPEPLDHSYLDIIW